MYIIGVVADLAAGPEDCVSLVHGGQSSLGITKRSIHEGGVYDHTLGIPYRNTPQLNSSTRRVVMNTINKHVGGSSEGGGAIGPCGSE